jgi:predicted component of type VI protein secretion system
MSEVKLTRSVPLSIIVVGVLQTVAVVWFVAHLDSQVAENTESLSDRKLWMEKRETFESDITHQMIRLSMTVEQLTTSSKELNDSVKKLTSQVRSLPE